MVGAQAILHPKITCQDCVHHKGMGFEGLSCPELTFLSAFKQSHEVAWSGDLLVEQEQSSCLIGTLYSGMAIKYRQLDSGKRQIMTVLLPGDMLGLECIHSDRPSHSIEAVTDVTYCLFARDRWCELLEQPQFAARLFKRQMVEQRQLEDRLVSFGACSGPGRVATFLVDLHQRMLARRLAGEGSFVLPLTNHQLADAVGLTAVHLGRVLNKLQVDGVMILDDRRVTVVDQVRLAALAEGFTSKAGDLPLI